MKMIIALLILILVLSASSPAAADPLDLSGPLTSAAIGRAPAAAGQTEPAAKAARSSDSSWDGALIGAGIGVVAGMLVAPRVMCGPDDGECSAIVRAAIGLPSVAGGVGLGWLVDRLHR
jgi:hypothetical protein